MLHHKWFQSIVPAHMSTTLGSFNNYLDQMLPNFDHLPPSSGQLLTFYILPTLCFRDQVWNSYWPPSTMPSNSSCLRSYWMTPWLVAAVYQNQASGSFNYLLSQTEFFMVVPKLYIPSTLNTDYLLWHTQLIVCAVKY